MSEITRTEVNRVVRAARRIDSRSRLGDHPADVRGAHRGVDDPRAGRAPAAGDHAHRPPPAAERRLADLGASATAALATIERAGPLTPSELAEAERVKRPTATRIVARLEEAGLVEPGARPRRRPLLADQHHARRRARAAAATAQAQGRLPGAAARGARRARRRDACAAPPRSSSGCSRRSGVERRRQAILRSPQILNYRLYFAGQIASLAGNWMQIVAELWLILQLTDSGAAVGIATALQFSGHPPLRRARRLARRPLRQAQAADRHPDRDGGARAGAVRRSRSPGRREHRRRLRADRPARPRARRRQPGPTGVRDRDRRPRPRRQRGRR